MNPRAHHNPWPFTADEEKCMWDHIYARLRAGDEAARHPHGQSLAVVGFRIERREGILLLTNASGVVVAYEKEDKLYQMSDLMEEEVCDDKLYQMSDLMEEEVSDVIDDDDWKPNKNLKKLSSGGKPSKKLQKLSTSRKPSEKLENLSPVRKPSKKLEKSSPGKKPSAKLENLSPVRKPSKKLEILSPRSSMFVSVRKCERKSEAGKSRGAVTDKIANGNESEQQVDSSGETVGVEVAEKSTVKNVGHQQVDSNGKAGDPGGETVGAEVAEKSTDEIGSEQQQLMDSGGGTVGIEVEQREDVVCAIESENAVQTVRQRSGNNSDFRVTTSDAPVKRKTLSAFVDDELKSLLAQIDRNQRCTGAQKMKAKRTLKRCAEKAKQIGVSLNNYLDRIRPPDL
ncbi:unnamed protein product [Gongylonema pulchrum]|uniref:DUF4378 domain-containing protein n=1 Tax=Gongylonema pulchrum TaxID=637853 RepID=A0A183DTW8_9BILA|nr:unnamed protein product [Gongylonema pulchrum]